MESKPVIPSKARTSRSIIQVDEDVHLILDDSDVDISVATPSQKSIELPRKTYSKRNPIVYQPVTAHETSNRLDAFLNHGASSSISKNSLLPPGNKNLLRKRKKDIEPIFSKSPAPKKSVRRNTSFKYRNISQSNTPKDSRPSTSKSFNLVPVKHEGSSDSEIEILSVKLSSSVEKSTNGTMKKFSNNNNNLNNKKSNKCFESMAKKELLINEAEIAPFVPINPIFPDPPNRANSMRWLNANGTVAVPGYSQGFSPSTIKPQIRSENGSVSAEKSNSLLSLDMKFSNDKKSKGKRELKGLYENLNEISWAHETSFKNLLRSPDYIRHSERSTGRIAGTGKNLRKLKPQTQPQTERKKRETAASLLARKKSKLARLNHTQKEKQAVREKLLSRTQNKKEGKQAQIINKKKVIPKLKSTTARESSDDDSVRYKLASCPPKLKQSTVTKTKTVGTKTKLSNGLKIKTEPSKLNSDAQKVKSNIFKLKPDKPKTKLDVAKVKNYVPIMKYDNSPPSTSGLQSGASSSKGMSHNKSADMRSSLKKSNFPPEMQFFQSMMDADNSRYSAAAKGNDVWVMLQPLENTKLWSADFYEEFRKYLLDQALCKVIETRDLESVRNMYDGLLESFINTQINNSNSGNSRVSKKKKNEEESVRSSIRQSEGAFRYKEIVVKKNKNYIQVVLVPNGIKKNSLSIEALKELKEAFVLAKKDSNIHAVLLNSSGSYFCTGVDLSPLVGSNKKQAAEDLASSIHDLVMTLAFFTKPVVAAVNGTAVGFGVSLLTYCDVVLASDKATFCLPSAKIGYLPEGGATLTLPQVIGTSSAAEMFLQGRRLTADEAKRCGLVSEVLWPTSLMNDVMPRLEKIAQQPLQAMEATKAMVRCHLWGKLKAHMDHERRLLVEHWLAPQCQENIKNVLKNGWFDD
ncbi:uncharacterized protein LOC129988211 isoform X2 [Argiope bruennichi]|nr:uncharacterized protein LOC129988211 isoform X2 [Argiope bruennichi]